MYRYIMHIWTPIIEPLEAADSSGKKFNARLVSNLNFPETNISTCMKAAPEEKMATMMTMNGLVFVCVRIIQALHHSFHSRLPYRPASNIWRTI